MSGFVAFQLWMAVVTEMLWSPWFPPVEKK